MTDLRHIMLYLGITAGDAFLTEKIKIDPIGFTFDGAQSLMLDLVVRVYKTVEFRSTQCSPLSSYSSSSAYVFAPALSSLYLAMHPPMTSFMTIDLTNDVVERGDAMVAGGGGGGVEDGDDVVAASAGDADVEDGVTEGGPDGGGDDDIDVSAGDGAAEDGAAENGPE